MESIRLEYQAVAFAPDGRELRLVGEEGHDAWAIRVVTPRIIRIIVKCPERA